MGMRMMKSYIYGVRRLMDFMGYHPPDLKFFRFALVQELWAGIEYTAIGMIRYTSREP